MKIVCCFLFSFCFTIAASAQKVYFIYLETENNQPFYVKMGDQLYSSGSGYLILSNLTDSTYNFSVGYPSSAGESRFTVPVSGRDRGFLIRNFDYGTGLFDLQTLAVIRAQVDESRKNISYRTRNDDFTTLLAKASSDPSLLLVPIVVKQDVAVQKSEEKKEELKTKVEEMTPRTDTIASPPKTDITETKKQETTPPLEVKDPKNVFDSTSITKQAEVNQSTGSNSLENRSTIKDTVASVTETITKEPESNSIPVSAEEYKRSVIKKHAESSTSEGFGLVFYDVYDGGVDTIRLLIPNSKIIISQNESNQLNEDKLMDMKTDTMVTVPKIVVAPSKSSGIIARSNCKSVASESDFFKLRKNMAAKTTDETMVQEAKKIFKNKCFTTEQVKNLGTLFLTSAGKYQFFDAAYLHVTDREQFSTLQSEITDEYYLKRFKALVGQ